MQIAKIYDLFKPLFENYGILEKLGRRPYCVDLSLKAHDTFWNPPAVGYGNHFNFDVDPSLSLDDANTNNIA